MPEKTLKEKVEWAKERLGVGLKVRESGNYNIHSISEYQGFLKALAALEARVEELEKEKDTYVHDPKYGRIKGKLYRRPQDGE